MLPRGDPGDVLRRRGRDAGDGHRLHEHAGELPLGDARLQRRLRGRQRALGHVDRRPGWPRPPRAALIGGPDRSSCSPSTSSAAGKRLRQERGRAGRQGIGGDDVCAVAAPSMPWSTLQEVRRVERDAVEVLVGDVLGDALVPRAQQVDAHRSPARARSPGRTRGSRRSTAGARPRRSGRWPRDRRRGCRRRPPPSRPSTRARRAMRSAASSGRTSVTVTAGPSERVVRVVGHGLPAVLGDEQHLLGAVAGVRRRPTRSAPARAPSPAASTSEASKASPMSLPT